MLETRHQAITGLAALSLLLTPLLALAAPDHLVCRRTKETTPPATYSADLVSSAYAGMGCTIKVPAKIFCEEATTANVSPPPPFAQFHGRGNPGRFLCYRLKCPKRLDTISMTDALGTHVTQASTPKLVCVPEVATDFSSCPGPGADCNSCTFGCAAHADAAPPTNICVNPLTCYQQDVPCTSDAGCLAGYACTVDPLNASQTACCNACPP